jgi:CheY-like chemotaxis protein
VVAYLATWPTILVVDDDAAILELIKSLLEDEFQVVCASDGWEALSLAAESQPDVVLLDLMMPGINGLTLTEELRKLPLGRNLPVFVMTAHRGLQPEIERLNVAGLFLKPFEPDLLVAEIESAVGHDGRQPFSPA